MSNNIYSDLWGEVLENRTYNRTFVQLYDGNGSRYNPNLILGNMFCVEKLRDFLNEVLEKFKPKKEDENAESKE